MTTLYRCDRCFDLIDPIEGDQRATLTVELRIEDTRDSIGDMDLCEDCRPDSAGAFLDRADYHWGESEGEGP